VVFARAPEDEQRFKPLLGTPAASRAGLAAALHRRLVERALTTAAGVTDADVLLVTTRELARAEEAAGHQVPASRLRVLPQTGSTFAERYESAVRQAFAAGYHHVIVVGSDTPELDQAQLEQAFIRLEHGARVGATAVLGPALDGGYYLLGLTAFSRAPFVGIPFGGPEVTATTVAALEHAGYAVSLLEALPDIDERADVALAAARLCARGRPGDAQLRVLMLAILAVVVTPAAWPEPHACSPDEFGPCDARGPPAPSSASYLPHLA
jgi:rSAM/selenodomain-associated transferase 1